MPEDILHQGGSDEYGEFNISVTDRWEKTERASARALWDPAAQQTRMHAGENGRLRPVSWSTVYMTTYGTKLKGLLELIGRNLRPHNFFFFFFFR